MEIKYVKNSIRHDETKIVLNSHLMICTVYPMDRSYIYIYIYQSRICQLANYLKNNDFVIRPQKSQSSVFLGPIFVQEALTFDLIEFTFRCRATTINFR